MSRPRYIGTIDETAVRKGGIRRAVCSCCGRGGEFVSLLGAIGRVMPIDIGKRVYDTGDGVIQVENDEQRDQRLARERNV